MSEPVKKSWIDQELDAVEQGIREELRADRRLLERLRHLEVGELNEWEAGFIPGIIKRLERRRLLTPKQRECALRILVFQEEESAE